MTVLREECRLSHLVTGGGVSPVPGVCWSHSARRAVSMRRERSAAASTSHCSTTAMRQVTSGRPCARSTRRTALRWSARAVSSGATLLRTAARPSVSITRHTMASITKQRCLRQREERGVGRRAGRAR